MAFDLAGKSESVMDKVLTFVVVLALIGGTIALVFTNLGTVITAFKSPDTGNDTLDSIIPILGLVVGVIVVFGIVRLIKKAVGAEGEA